MAARVKSATPSTIDAVDVALERAGDEAQRGNPAEAHKQFAAAQKLFLSATDQRVLAAVRPLVKG